MIRRSVVALIVGVLVVVALPAAAGAAPDSPNPQSGPPNGEGAWMYCNDSVSPSGSSSSSVTYTYTIQCEYGPTTLKVHELFYEWYTSTGSGQSNTCGYASSGEAGRITDDKPGRITCVQTEPRNTGGTTWSTAIANNTGGATKVGCSIGAVSFQVGTTTSGSVTNTFSAPNPGVQVPAEVQLSCTVGQPPGYPSVFWPGGGTSSSTTFDPSDPADGNTTSGSGSDCGAWWHIGCYVEHALSWAFVPDGTTLSDDVAAVQADAADRFPFSMVADVTTALTTFFGDLNNTLDDPGYYAGCYWEPLYNVNIPVPGGGDPYNFNPQIPDGNPTCTYSTGENNFLSLFGWGSLLRSVVALVLWITFFMKVIRAFGVGGASDELAPEVSE